MLNPSASGFPPGTAWLISIAAYVLYDPANKLPLKLIKSGSLLGTHFIVTIFGHFKNHFYDDFNALHLVCFSLDHFLNLWHSIQ